MSTDRRSGTGSRLLAGAPTILVGTLAVLGFVVAVQLMGAGMRDLAPALGPWLRRSLDPDAAALGAGWLVAYGMLNGSVVAAVAVTLFDAGLVSVRELFLLVVGSRLGAAAMVVLVGGVDYLQRRETALGEALDLGLFTFLLTHTIYLPVAVVGALTVDAVVGAGAVPPGWLGTVPLPLEALGGAVDVLARSLGGLLSVGVALSLFLASLRIIDRLFARLDTERLEDRYLAVLDRPWLSFFGGLVVTALTTSVAVSVGIAVPLYNRGHLTREQMAPYVLGTSLGTLVDTLLVAVVVGSPAALLTVGFVLVVGTATSLIALTAFGRYFDALDGLQSRLVTERRAFGAFVLALIAVPAGLVALALLT
ncbi:MAG: sodium:phosphate symporter [Halanaeroarchaeum sp.]